jgi:hypothetical protein
MLHAPHAQVSIKLGWDQPGELTVMIEQTQRLVVGRLGLGLLDARGQQDEQRDGLGGNTAEPTISLLSKRNI